jgi:hypothetical protein
VRLQIAIGDTGSDLFDNVFQYSRRQHPVAMHRNCDETRLSVCVPKMMVAAFDPNNFKAEAQEHRQNILAT